MCDHGSNKNRIHRPCPHRPTLKPVSLNPKSKFPDVKRLFEKQFKGIIFRDSTFYDHRQRYQDASQELRDRLAKAGRSSEGRWSKLMVEVPARRRELQGLRKQKRREQCRDVQDDTEDDLEGSEKENQGYLLRRDKGKGRMVKLEAWDEDHIFDSD